MCSTCPAPIRPVANKDNDYLIDRAAQQRGDTYSGVEGIAMQDASLQESMGPIVDRTQGEPRLHRQRHHHGAPPPDPAPPRRWPSAARARPASISAHQRVRSAALVLPPDQVFKDAAREALTVRPGTAPATV